ncbi:MAG: hypothetical protein SNG14_02960, partial [Rikenellaceae bacterium]
KYTHSPLNQNTNQKPCHLLATIRKNPNKTANDKQRLTAANKTANYKQRLTAANKTANYKRLII